MKIFEDFLETANSHEEKLFAVRNATQAELAADSGINLEEWINRYAKVFKETLEAHPTILENLLDKNTHDDTIAELKNKLYH